MFVNMYSLSLSVLYFESSARKGIKDSATKVEWYQCKSISRIQIYFCSIGINPFLLESRKCVQNAVNSQFRGNKVKKQSPETKWHCG